MSARTAQFFTDGTITVEGNMSLAAALKALVVENITHLPTVSPGGGAGSAMTTIIRTPS